MNFTKWTEDEIDFLIENYPLYGICFCMKPLKKTSHTIKKKVLELGLEREEKISKVPTFQFLNITTKEVAYFLGFLWADGHVGRTSITIETKKDDMVHIIDTFKKLGEFSINERFRNNSLNKQMSIGIHNTKLCDILIEHDYDKKSHVSPTKILNKIPDGLKHYFFRGWIDGDGCFFYRYEENRKYFSLTSTYDQDWADFTNLLDKLNCTYGIRKPIRKNGHKNSTIDMSSQSNITMFGNYVYNGMEEDQIGLPRKYETFLKIKNHVSKADDNKKPVAQYDLGGNLIRSYRYVSQVKEFGFKSYTCVCKCCDGKQSKAYGYVWKWL